MGSPVSSSPPPGSPLLARAAHVAGSGRLAIRDDRGDVGFAELMGRAARVAAALGPLGGRRVLLLCTQDADWVASCFGVFFAGGVVVPLSPAYPPAELGWFARDAGADAAIVSPELHEQAAELARGRRIAAPADLIAAGAAGPASLDPAAAGPDDVALLLYTSGTTGKPKGAMITHANLAVQAELLRDAWGVTPEDRLLHALPLHHLHGLGISLFTALLAGASARMLPRFDVARVTGAMGEDGITLWMAVPTMYHRLREHGDRARLARAAAALRLATSGSAALPVSLADWWRGLAGAVPLERFGMTEIGVGMSNPLDPARRRPGFVGLPLPTVEVKLVDDDGVASERGPAELWIRGPSVFAGYHGREGATAAAFAEGAWFKTGDIAERPEGTGGPLRLLGRTSVDILKSGGYKISALEIEEVLRDHPDVAEVAVVGLPDEAWGERVVAAVVARAPVAPDALRAFARQRLAAYKVPRELVIVAELPKNAVGKVVKPDVVRLLRSR